MPRRSSKRKSKKFLGLEKREKYALLVVGMFVVLLGASTTFSTFGFESVWGADVQFDSIAFMDAVIESPEDLPEYSFNVGSRTVTSDFDGKVEATHWDTATTLWGDKAITYADEGTYPTVNYDLSRFKYYNNITEELDESQAFMVVDNINEEVDVHFFFGFSIAFSTAAYSVPMPATDVYAHRVFIPRPGVHYGWGTETYVESNEVEMTSTVALRFEAFTGDFDYSGSVNDITVIGERAYYVTRPPGVEYETIEEFNDGYEWKSPEHYVPGYAVASGTPQITYDVIDSASENMATIEASVKLRPALDPVVTSEVVALEGLYPGYVVVDGIDTFNVGFIYDIVVDVSINDIPLYDESAILAMGRYGVNLPIPLPEPWYLSELALILIVIVSAVIFMKVRR